MGRLETLRGLYAAGRRTLNLGAKGTSEGTLRIDIDVTGRPDVVGSALAIPVRDCVFEQVLFTDVIEHLPGGTEPQALLEIARVLAPGGVLILSTPNHRRLFTYTDPAYWLQGHRHYTGAQLRAMVEASGMIMDRAGTFGGARDMLALLWMYAFFPVKILTGRYPGIAEAAGSRKPDALREDDRGYTRFVVARKP